MTDYAFAPPKRPALPVDGSAALFPVRRIFCVGRNYAEHAREMGNDDRDPPFFFAKPADALVGHGRTIPFPPATADLHHEAELVVALGSGGRDLSPEDAAAAVWGHAAGNDLTRRDLQAQAKSMRRPWDMAKGFDLSAVCGAIRPTEGAGPMTRGTIRCTVDDAPRQQGDVADMIWSVPEILSALSALVELAPGDLIYTGTPAGVGPLSPGSTCRVEIEGLPPVEVTLAG